LSELAKMLDEIDIVASMGNPRRPDTHRRILQDEVTRLEREWKPI
jgi:hypothetical protein